MRIWMDRWTVGTLILCAVIVVGILVYVATVSLGWWVGPAVLGLVALPWLIGLIVEKIWDVKL